MVDRGLAPKGPSSSPRLGGYVLERVLGRGGMGTVYLGRGSDGMPRAIKVPTFEGANAAERRARFDREARAVARLAHPGIVRVDALGEENGVAFCVFELVDGESLDAVIARGPLAIDRALEIGATLARSLAHAHAHGVIHRDVKPSNVIVRPDGGPVLMDFGLAREDGAAALTRTGAFLGTPQYMAPEQVGSARETDHRADVYALGATFYELLTGAPPFEGDTPLEILSKVSSAPPEPPSRRRAEISPDIDAVVLRALEKDPDRRYASAGEMAADLERARQGERTSARPRGAHRSLGVLAATVVAVAVAAGVVVIRRSSQTDSHPTEAAARALDSVRVARAPWLRARLGLDVPTSHVQLDAALREADAARLGDVVARTRAQVDVEDALARGDGSAARARASSLGGDGEGRLLVGLAELSFGDPALARGRLDALAHERGLPVDVAQDAALGAARAELARGDARAALRRASELSPSPGDLDRHTAVAHLRARCHAAIAEEAARRAAAEECAAALGELEEAPAFVASACAVVARAALDARATKRPPRAVLAVLVAAWDHDPRAFADRALAPALLNLAGALFAAGDVPGTARAYEMACVADEDAALPPDVLEGIAAAAGFSAFLGKKWTIEQMVDLELALIRVGELSKMLDAGPSTDAEMIRELELRRSRAPKDWAIDADIAWRSKDHEQAVRCATRALACPHVPPRARACAFAVRADHLQPLGRKDEELVDLEAALAGHFGRPDVLRARVSDLLLATGRVEEAVKMARRALADGELRCELSARGFAALSEGQPPGRPLSPAGAITAQIRSKPRLALARALIVAGIFEEASLRLHEVAEITTSQDVLKGYAGDLDAFAGNLSKTENEEGARVAHEEAAKLRRR